MHVIPVTGKLTSNFIDEFQIVLSNIRKKKPRELRGRQVNKILIVNPLLRIENRKKKKEYTKMPKAGKCEQSTEA